MTAIEQRNYRAAQIQKTIGYPNIMDAFARVDQDDPGLAQRALLESQGHPATIANCRSESPGAIAKRIAHREAIHQGVGAIMAKDGCDYDTAWQRFQFTHPEFANSMSASGGLPRQAGTLAPDAAKAAQQAPTNTELFSYSLPLDASAEELAAAKAAGTQDPAKLFLTMVKFTAIQIGCSNQNATLICRGRYPKMHVAAQAAGLINNLGLNDDGQGKSKAV